MEASGDEESGEMTFPDKSIIEHLKLEYPVGMKVRLVEMKDELSRILDNASYQDF